MPSSLFCLKCSKVCKTLNLLRILLFFLCITQSKSSNLPLNPPSGEGHNSCRQTSKQTPHQTKTKSIKPLRQIPFIFDMNWVSYRSQLCNLQENTQVWWKICNEKHGLNIVMSDDKSFYFKTFKYFFIGLKFF